MIQIGASAATVDSPIEHLMACHRRIEQRLDTLVNAACHLENMGSCVESIAVHASRRAPRVTEVTA